LKRASALTRTEVGGLLRNILFLKKILASMPCASSAEFPVLPKEESVLADFGKKLILGLIAAACVVGAHAAMVSAVVG
jgi:hypothetical protein